MLRRALILLGLTLLVSAPAMTESLSKADRDKAIKQLEYSRKVFLQSIKGLTEEQWKWKAAPDRWSVAECAEHLALTENLIKQVISERVLKSPATPEKSAAARLRDDEIHKAITDRSKKFQAPEPIQPKSTFKTEEETKNAFEAARASNIQYVKTTQDDLRSHFAPHPVMKEIDGLQWMLLLSAHTERHTAQIKEVEADPKFPKRK